MFIQMYNFSSLPVFKILVVLNLLVVVGISHSVYTSEEEIVAEYELRDDYKLTKFGDEKIAFLEPDLNKTDKYLTGKISRVHTVPLDLNNGHTVGIRGFKSPDGDEDIAFIGASHTFGAGVNTSDLFSTKVEEESSFETVNLGIPGGGFREFNLIHKHVASEMPVNYVVVFVSRNTAVSQQTQRKIAEKANDMSESSNKTSNELFLELFLPHEERRLNEIKKNGSAHLKQLKDRAEKLNQTVIFIDRDAERLPEKNPFPYGINARYNTMATIFGNSSGYRIHDKNMPNRDLHYNEKGHRLMTQVILEELSG